MQVPVDLRGAGDDVVRMARAVFSDRVRLLWSDGSTSPATVENARSYRSGDVGQGSVKAGRWPSPGPMRRPLYIPWRVRHFLAYTRRRTQTTRGHDVTLDIMLIRFKEVQQYERFVFLIYVS